MAATLYWATSCRKGRWDEHMFCALKQVFAATSRRKVTRLVEVVCCQMVSLGMRTSGGFLKTLMVKRTQINCGTE